jgi:hypothetical protein
MHYKSVKKNKRKDRLKTSYKYRKIFVEKNIFLKNRKNRDFELF